MGSVDDKHNQAGEPLLPADNIREERDRRTMVEAPFILDEETRRIVLRTLEEVSRHRGWRILAAHVRSNHVHVVVQGDDHPDKIMQDYKAYCTRRLKEAGFEPQRTKRWTEGGSTRYLWREEQVAEKVDYVVNQQGGPMEVFVADEYLRTKSEPEA